MPVKGLQLLPFVAAVMFASAAPAQEQPHSMLDSSFDLKRAILSPAPFGPPSQFEPRHAVAKPEAVASEAIAPRKTVSSKPRQKAAVAAARKPISNPFDSYARDARGQAWPCTGGGICAWTQPR